MPALLEQHKLLDEVFTCSTPSYSNTAAYRFLNWGGTCSGGGGGGRGTTGTRKR
jgi:hypothetical protein